jgi:predicted ribosome-associated RNA-binding protein Tma20
LVSGNIIITSERPKYHYYEGNPFLIYKDPREIPLIIETIAKMTVEEKQKIVDKGNVFYKERYSPDYFASLIEKRLF